MAQMDNDTKARLMVAQALAKEGRGAVARQVLEGISHPKAAVLRAKLPSGSGSSSRPLQMVVVLVLLLLVGLGSFFIGRASAPVSVLNVLGSEYAATTTAAAPAVEASRDSLQATIDAAATARALTPPVPTWTPFGQ